LEQQSFREMQLVHQDLLQDRIHTIKTLEESDTESYSIVKDKETGEHYLHYAYMHIEVAGSGEKEYFHQLLPLDSDQVLELLFEKPPFAYPAHWNQSYLRSGPNEAFVWFDPIGNNEFDQMEAVGREMAERIRAFKEKGSLDKESIQKLLDDVDRM
jgi:hypothetical protein